MIIITNTICEIWVNAQISSFTYGDLIMSAQDKVLERYCLTKIFELDLHTWIWTFANNCMGDQDDSFDISSVTKKQALEAIKKLDSLEGSTLFNSLDQLPHLSYFTSTSREITEVLLPLLN